MQIGKPGWRKRYRAGLVWSARRYFSGCSRSDWITHFFL